MNKLELYYKDKKILEDMFGEDNNDYFLFMVRLIYNSFITNHILIDGNKRMFRSEMKELIKKVSEESLR